MLVFIASLAVFLASIALAAAVKALPPAELKRQARADKKSSSASIYKLVSYGASLDLLLGALVISSFIGSILAAAEISWWLVAGVFIASLLVWLKDPNGKNGRIHWTLAGYIAYPADWLLRLLHPILRRLAMVSRKPRRTRPHTRAYQKEDLLDLLKLQATQPDNRISDADLKMARRALNFDDKTVGQIMTPKRKVKFVAAADAIGPHLMDELHASGSRLFPVVKDSASAGQRTANPEIIGTLHLNDLVDHSHTGKVKDIAQGKVFFINETQSLREALGIAIQSGQRLLIVVNNFEEIVGVLSLEDILRQLVGNISGDDFGRYDDVKVAAGQNVQKSVVE